MTVSVCRLVEADPPLWSRLLDWLPWNFVQMIIVPRGWMTAPLVGWHMTLSQTLVYDQISAKQTFPSASAVIWFLTKHLACKWCDYQSDISINNCNFFSKMCAMNLHYNLRSTLDLFYSSLALSVCIDVNLHWEDKKCVHVEMQAFMLWNTCIWKYSIVF